jgi:hypothetical protein
MRSISQEANVSINTVAELLVDVGKACAAFGGHYLAGVSPAYLSQKLDRARVARSSAFVTGMFAFAAVLLAAELAVAAPIDSADVRVIDGTRSAFIRVGHLRWSKHRSTWMGPCQTASGSPAYKIFRS